MRKLSLLIGILLLSIPVVQSQDCSKYYPLTSNTEFQITSYDKRDRVNAIIDYKVQEVAPFETGEKATVLSSVKDKNGDLIVENNVDMTCVDGVVSMDFRSMISPQLFKQYEGMEIEMTGTNLDFPNSLAEGDELPDADVLMKINMGGINMNMNLKVSNRKVIGRETITTPAGTFDCYIISYDNEVDMGLRKVNSAKQWIAEGVGMVKQEDYKRNGTIVSKSVLTHFNKS